MRITEKFHLGVGMLITRGGKGSFRKMNLKGQRSQQKCFHWIQFNLEKQGGLPDRGNVGGPCWRETFMTVPVRKLIKYCVERSKFKLQRGRMQ